MGGSAISVFEIVDLLVYNVALHIKYKSLKRKPKDGQLDISETTKLNTPAEQLIMQQCVNNKFTSNDDTNVAIYE